MGKLVSPKEALEKILDKSQKTNTEYVDVLSAAGRVAADNPSSKRNLPPHDNSAMDGYAVKFEDLTECPAKLLIKGVIQAGDNVENLHLNRGEAYKIMTGAFVPSGSDTVIEYELTDIQDNFIIINDKKKFGANIRRKGEDLKIGDEIDIKGRLITPEIQSRLVSSGIMFLKVYRKPRIAVLGTGNELIFPEGSGSQSSTIDSNSFYVLSVFKSMGAEVSYLGISKDDTPSFITALNGYTDYDIIVTSAGISTGDFDVVMNSTGQLKIDWLFNGVKQKPGKPFSFGLLNENKLLFSLPGNPVSSAFCAYFYLIPAFKKISGYNFVDNPSVIGYLTDGFYKKNNRFHFNRGVLKYSSQENKFLVTPYKEQESHIINSIYECNCFIVADEAMTGKIDKGTQIECLIYDYSTVF